MARVPLKRGHYVKHPKKAKKGLIEPFIEDVRAYDRLDPLLLRLGIAPTLPEIIALKRYLALNLRKCDYTQEKNQFPTKGMLSSKEAHLIARRLRNKVSSVANALQLVSDGHLHTEDYFSRENGVPLMVYSSLTQHYTALHGDNKDWWATASELMKRMQADLETLNAALEKPNFCMAEDYFPSRGRPIRYPRYSFDQAMRHLVREIKAIKPKVGAIEMGKLAKPIYRHLRVKYYFKSFYNHYFKPEIC